MSQKALRRILGDRIVGYHPVLAKISGGAAEGVLLSQLLYWHGVMSDARGPDWDGWFWKVARELYEETGMTRAEFETARANLIHRGFVEFEVRGVPNRAHYRVDLDKLTAALEQADEYAHAHNRKFLKKGEKATDPVAVDAQEADAVGSTSEPLNTGSQFVENEHVENGHAENQQPILSEMGAPVCSNSANLNAENAQTIHKSTSSDFQKTDQERDGDAHVGGRLRHALTELFVIPGDASWGWLDELLIEIEDPQILRDVAARMSAMGKYGRPIFDRSEFVRIARFSYKREGFSQARDNRNGTTVIPAH